MNKPSGYEGVTIQSVESSLVDSKSSWVGTPYENYVESSSKIYESILRQRLEMARLSSMMGEKIVTEMPDWERTLKFKGVTFLVSLPEEIMEFFEDTGDIQHGEMMMLDVAFPNQYKKIKEAWTIAYFQLQFEKY